MADFDRYLAACEDRYAYRCRREDDEGREIQCACCPDVDVRYFHGTPLCKCCAAETPSVCGECGGIDHTTSTDGPTTCCDCRAVECCKSVDWEDGEIRG